MTPTAFVRRSQAGEPIELVTFRDGATIVVTLDSIHARRLAADLLNADLMDDFRRLADAGTDVRRDE